MVTFLTQMARRFRESGPFDAMYYFFYIAVHTGLMRLFFFSSRRRHTSLTCDWSSDVCSSDLGEQRVVAKGSIGIGGHMNETDESLFAMDEEAYRAGVEREVSEEVKIETPFEDRIVALLNDDSTEVGRVHLGIVHIFKLKEPQVQKREAMITGLTFLTKQELKARRESLETWSQICVDAIDQLLA